VNLKLRILALCCLLCAVASAQWSTPVQLPADSASDMMPAITAVDDSGLVCAWVSSYGYMKQQVRASRYRWETGWQPWFSFSDLTPEIAVNGPGLAAEPQRGGVLAAYYNGSYPTDDAWGIWTTFRDSAGGQAPRLALTDSGVTDLVLRAGEDGFLGLFWSNIRGSGPNQYMSVWFCPTRADTWWPRQLVGAGSNAPDVVNCHQPAMCRDTGGRFLAAYGIQAPGISRVRVLTLPDTTTIGEFEGDQPALVSDLNGTLWLAHTKRGSTENFLLVRKYAGGVWSEPETLCRSATPNVRPRLCVDPQGYFWLAYSSGLFTPPWWLEVRYHDGTRWSAAEAVAPGGVTSYPVIASSHAGHIWLVWNQGVGNRTGVFAARRLSRPGVGEAARTMRASVGGRPTIIRGVLRMGVDSRQHTAYRAELLDISGRRALDLKPGANDVSRLAPGVYFVRTASGVERLASGVAKVVLTR